MPLATIYATIYAVAAAEMGSKFVMAGEPAATRGDMDSSKFLLKYMKLKREKHDKGYCIFVIFKA